MFDNCLSEVCAGLSVSVLAVFAVLGDGLVAKASAAGVGAGAGSWAWAGRWCDSLYRLAASSLSLARSSVQN